MFSTSNLSYIDLVLNYFQFGFQSEKVDKVRLAADCRRLKIESPNGFKILRLLIKSETDPDTGANRKLLCNSDLQRKLYALLHKSGETSQSRSKSDEDASNTSGFDGSQVSNASEAKMCYQEKGTRDRYRLIR